MRVKSELEMYYDLVEKKWFILAFLCAVSISFICVLVFLDWQALGWPFPAATALACFGAAVIYAFFYEWHLLSPRSTRLALFHENIIHMAVARSRFLDIDELRRRVKNLIALLFFLVLSSIFSWLYPKLWYLTSILIGGFSGVLVSYQIEEEINAPREYRQLKMTIFSLLIFGLLGSAGWLVSEFGPKFGNSNFSIYWVYISAAFACGVLITFVTNVPKIYRHYLSRKEI
ncbi:hypothetical protein K6Y31_21935 [Motilimonas cestriensis]|uniref:Uncharacterized protein n=1 Tax=Motilimonas cestriensis TaxID=2742685 RepID=A0ABS8WEG1_9GAMM|nr:hypothetical protein [Motilimonas cestriensis]MCE2597429.1 hypothetical protein [Motilimonas cestriensis]